MASTMTQQRNNYNNNLQFQINDAVYISQPHQQNQLQGVVLFVGQVDFASGKWVGVRLTGNSVGEGNTDGEVSGKRYFSSDVNCGVFVRPDQVTKRKLNRIEELRLKREAILTPVKHQLQSKSCNDLEVPTVTRSLSKIEEIRARREAFSQRRLKFESASNSESKSVASENVDRSASSFSQRRLRFESPSSNDNVRAKEAASPHSAIGENWLPTRNSPRALHQSNQNNHFNNSPRRKSQEAQESPSSSVNSESANRSLGSETLGRSVRVREAASPYSVSGEKSLPPRYTPRALHQPNQSNGFANPQRRKSQEEQKEDESMRKRIIELESEMETISKKLHDTTKELKNREDETLILRQTMSDAHHIVSGSKAEVLEHRRNLEDEKAKNETLQKKLIELEDHTENIFRKFDEKSKALQDKEEESTMLRQSLTDALENKSKFTEQEKALKEEQEKNKTMQNRIIELEERIKAETMQNKEKEATPLRQPLAAAQHNALRNDVEVLEQQNTPPNEQKENETTHTRITELENNITTITKSLEEMAEKLQSKEEETAMLRKSLSDAQHSVFDFKLRAAKLEQEVNKAKAESGTGPGVGAYEIPFKKELQERIFMRMEHELETSREELEAERIFKSAEAEELDDLKQSLFEMEQELKTTLAHSIPLTHSLPSSPSSLDSESDVKTQWQAFRTQLTMLQMNFTKLNQENNQKTKELNTLQKSLDLVKQDGLENESQVQQPEDSAIEALLKIKEDEIESQKQEIASLKETLEKEKEHAVPLAAGANGFPEGDSSMDEPVKPIESETDNEEISRLKTCLSRVEQDAYYFKTKYEGLLLATETESLLANEKELLASDSAEERKDVERVLQELEQEEPLLQEIRQKEGNIVVDGTEEDTKSVLQDLEEEEEVKLERDKAKETKALFQDLQQTEANLANDETEEDTTKQNGPANPTDQEVRIALDEMDMFFDDPENQADMFFDDTENEQQSDTQLSEQSQSALTDSPDSIRKEGRDDNCVEEEKVFADFKSSSMTQATDKNLTKTDDEAIDSERETTNIESATHKTEETTRSSEEGGSTKKRGRNKMTFWKRRNRKDNKGKSNSNTTKNSKTNKVNFNSLMCGPRQFETMGEF